MALFIYGTLLDDILRDRLAGGDPMVGVPAILPDHRVVKQATANLPYLIFAKGETAQGMIFTQITDAQHARLNAYEVLFGYASRPVTVDTVDGAIAADAYFPDDTVTPSDTLWSFDAWFVQTAALSREMALEIGSANPQTLKAQWHMIGVRAAARLRARVNTTPTKVRRGPDPQTDVKPNQTTGDFFRFQSFHVTHPTFQGGMSDPLPREVFIGADAAIVLPYDPVSDNVLLVEQLRMGPLIREDVNPWCLEPVAGMIDAGETPEQAAMREMEEEAGLSGVTLEHMFSFYPTPGAVTDYHYCYAGLATLPAARTYTGGLASEAEDLRLHILPFENALALVESDEANVGPLIAMLYWLDRNRARLQAAA